MLDKSNVVIVVQLLSHVWLWPLGLQHAKLPCPSLSHGVCSNSCPLSWWQHSTISSSIASFPPALNLSLHWIFSKESALHFRWWKYWNFSFSISPSNESSQFISFRIFWFDILAVQGTLKSLLQHHNLKVSVLRCSAFCMVQLSHDYGRNHSYSEINNNFL